MIVALLAAATAQWRQRGQLRHDRELRDLEELRALLDECAQAAGAASQAFLPWMTALAHTNPRRPRGWRRLLLHGLRRPRLVALSDDVTLEIEDDEISELGVRERGFTAATEPIFALYQRVILRLGAEHPVTEAFATVQRVYAAYVASTDDIEEKELGSPERWEAVQEAQRLVRAAHFGFLEACQSFVGSRIRGR